MGQSGGRPRIMVRKRAFWWVAIDPDEPLGMMEASHTAIARALSRERVIEKARDRMAPRPSPWQEIEL